MITEEAQRSLKTASDRTGYGQAALPSVFLHLATAICHELAALREAMAPPTNEKETELLRE